MKFAETGFRELYHNFAVFPMNGALCGALEYFPDVDGAEGALVYGHAGSNGYFALEIIAAARKNGNIWVFSDTGEGSNSQVTVNAIAHLEYESLRDQKESLLKRYGEKISRLKQGCPEDILLSRDNRDLDDLRDQQNIDDVLVNFEKPGLKPEKCKSRIIGLKGSSFHAKLLQEPEQDFGIHCKDEFYFVCTTNNESGKVNCYADFSMPVKPAPPALSDGKLLKEAIHRFLVNNNPQTIFILLKILRNSLVWVPCNAVVGEKDQKTFLDLIRNAGGNLESLRGKTITSQQGITMEPDILINHGKYYFPVFSSVEEMGTYGERFSKVQKPFLETIVMAKNNRKFKEGCAGIVVNAFSEPFVLVKEVYEEVVKMTAI